MLRCCLGGFSSSAGGEAEGKGSRGLELGSSEVLLALLAAIALRRSSLCGFGAYPQIVFSGPHTLMATHMGRSSLDGSGAFR